MITYRWVIAALAIAGVTAFVPISPKNEALTARQAGFVSEIVRVLTFAGAAGVIYLADKPGSASAPPASSKRPDKATSAAASSLASVDVSIPYDAAAMLAYEASSKDTDFELFKLKYKEETVAMIKSKQKQPVAA
jgi:hypothetical protein